QAEDGIRDRTVTGVQTCALPILWPGAVLIDGEIVGTWRRAQRTMTVQTWQRLVPAAREAIAAEAESLPLPDAGAGMRIDWIGGRSEERRVGKEWRGREGGEAVRR